MTDVLQIESLLPLLAYEEEPPIPKTREEIIAEKLLFLQEFQFDAPEVPENDSTGALAYKDACEKIHNSSFMKFPISSVVKELCSEGETMDLSFVGLGKKGSAGLAAAMRINANITSLLLTGNFLTPSAALEIVRTMNQFHFMNFVDLSVNRLGEPDAPRAGQPIIRGGAVVNEMLGSGCTITSLMLRDNKLVDSDVALFSESLSDNVSVQVLDLSFNRMGYIGAMELAKVLARNGDLLHLNLEWNNFGSAGCRYLLAEGLMNNNTIKTLNLSSCGLDDSCAPIFSRVIAENATEELFVANNRLSSVGAEIIAKGLRNTSGLSSLVLDGNLLGDQGCNALLNVVLSGEVTSMHLLSLQHCGCSAATEARGQEGVTEGLCIHISEGFKVMGKRERQQS